MEEIQKQHLECIRRAGNVKLLLEQDNNEFGLCVKGDIRQSYRELMELELERIEQVRKDLNDEAAQDK